MNAYEKLIESEIKKLLESAQNLIHLINSFGKDEQLTNFVNVWMLEDAIQMPKTVKKTFSNIFLRKLFSFRRKQQSTQLQKANKKCY